MQIAAVIPLQRVLVVCIIILLADLIAAVEDRDSALGEEEGVEHDIHADGAVQLVVVHLVFCSFNAAQRGGRAAQTGIAQAWIIIVELAAGIAVVALAGQIIVEIFLVCYFLHAESLEEIVVKAPADIVVAAQIVQEGVVVRKCEDCLHLVAEQTHIVGCHCVPGAGHGRDIVEHVALGLLDGSEVGNDLGGLHDDFAQEQGSGADHLSGHAHHADQGVDLREVAAAGAQFLPDIRSSIQADDIDTVVAQVQHIRGHVIEDHRVGIVQIPLIGIESGHDHFAGLFTPGEVSGCGLREYLGNGLFKFARN